MTDRYVMVSCVLIAAACSSSPTGSPGDAGKPGVTSPASASDAAKPDDSTAKPPRVDAGAAQIRDAQGSATRPVKKQERGSTASTSSTHETHECTGLESTSCHVSLGDSTASCTAYGRATCGVDGHWGPCVGSCQTSYTHYGHTVHCEDLFCNVTRRCEQHSYGSKECTDSHNPYSSNRECCPSASRSCNPTCYAGGGSCMVIGTSYCDSSGHWGSCHGSCTLVPYGGGMITCTVN